MKKQKIGIVVYSNPDHYPPTINAVHELSESFDIILIGRNQEIGNWNYPDNVTVHRLGNYSSVKERGRMSFVQKITEYISFTNESKNLLNKNVSLIYAYEPWAYVAVNIINIIWFHPKPIIYQIHELHDSSSLTSLFGWIQKLEKAWINNALVVILADKDRSEIYQKKLSVDRKPIVVPNFPRKKFYQINQENNNYFEELIEKRFVTRKILLQGAISPDSSMLELVESLTELSSKYTLKFIGFITRDNYETLTKLVNQREVVSQVEYCDPVSYDELPHHTWSASIGTCLYKKTSSNHHLSVTSSNKIYEYAACGLPAILSDYPNYRKYLSQESWVRFVDPEDPKAIALAIQEVFSDFGTYRNMCLASREAFETKFNYETVFEPVVSRILSLTT
jgi:glycosyltransferase involved in cell wall biosynthesis